MQIDRVPSGIKGLDPLIEGGFPIPSIILVSGSAGSGKTTFGFQFLMEGAKMGERGIYISTLSESWDWALRFMSTFRFFAPSFVENGSIIYVDLGKELEEMNELKILQKIRVLVASHTPQRIVIDPINVVNHYVKNYRQFLFELVTMLKEWNTVTLITGEVKEGEKYPADVGYTADGIITLIMKVEGDIIKRYVQILKMRGTSHSLSNHPLEITEEGIEVLRARF